MREENARRTKRIYATKLGELTGKKYPMHCLCDTGGKLAVNYERTKTFYATGPGASECPVCGGNLFGFVEPGGVKANAKYLRP